MSCGCCCVLLLALVAAVSGVDIKAVVGGEVHFKPDIPEGTSLKDSSITWKYVGGGDVMKVIEWDNDFKTLESLRAKFNTRVALDRNTGELTIRDLQLEHTGLYTIEINNKEQEKKITLTVVGVVDEKKKVGDEVRFKPDITATTSLEDSSITWKYTAGGGEVMKVIEWDNDFKTLEHLSAKFSTRVALDRSTGELTIRDLQLEHTGLYTIEINNKEQVQKFSLTVIGVDEDVKKRVGGEVRFKPDILEGSLKDSSITWKYVAGSDVIKVIEWDNDFKSEESLDSKFKDRVVLDRNTGELTIRDLQLEHTGVYTIEINNKEQEKNFTLTVVGMVEDVKKKVGDEAHFKPDITAGTSLIDRSITWKYAAGSYVMKVIEWDNDFQTLESLGDKFKDRVALDRTTGELTIRDLQLEHTGLYTIEINNKEQKEKFKLTVMEQTSST